MGGRSGAARSGKEQQLEAFRGNQGAERQGAALDDRTPVGRGQGAVVSTCMLSEAVSAVHHRTPAIPCRCC